MIRSAHVRWLVGVSLLLGIAACSSDPAPGGGGGGSPGASGSGATVAGTGGLPSATGGGGSGGGSSVGGGTTATTGGGGAGVGGSGGGSGGSAGGGEATGGTSAGSGGSGGAGGSGGGASNQFTGTAKLMVLGSSNELQTCWRALLWKQLQDANIKMFDMVGGVTEGPDCGVAGYDKDLQAQSGIIITNVTAQQFGGWFSAHPPDAVLAHFGGADLLANMALDGVMMAYDRALEQARMVNPKVRFLLAQHTPMSSAGCNDCEHTVPELNQRIATWATEKTTAESPVIAVDLATGVNPATDTDDGIHLNVAGSTKVAARFFDAIKPFFD